METQKLEKEHILWGAFSHSDWHEHVTPIKNKVILSRKKKKK